MAGEEASDPARTSAAEDKTCDFCAKKRWYLLRGLGEAPQMYLVAQQSKHAVCAGHARAR
jgi:hypothetical protein